MNVNEDTTKGIERKSTRRRWNGTIKERKYQARKHWAVVHRGSLNMRYDACKNNARQNKHEWSLTKEHFQTLWNNACHYCGETIDGIGLDRVDTTKGYIEENVVPCRWKCNWMKRNLAINEFIEHCRRVILHSERNRNETRKVGS